jgi:hypothetical protein
MKQSVEVRWFRRGRCPSAVEDWFMQALSSPSAMPLAHEERRDFYLYPADADTLGIKLRGPNNDKLEIKQRQQDFGLTTFHSGVVGRVERWIRWSFSLATDRSGDSATTRPEGAWIVVGKTRDTRTFRVLPSGAVQEAPASDELLDGCTVELTHLDLAGQAWWSVALEAFGPLEVARSHFDAIAKYIFVERQFPFAFAADSSLSYPAWIRQYAGRADGVPAVSERG